MRQAVIAFGMVMIALGVSACGSGGKEDPIMVLSSAEALETGKALLAEGKYRRAREYLTHAFEVEPNSVGGREALLLAADAYYAEGGPDNYVRAEARYRDFQTRFPTSEQAAYVQFRIASALSQRINRPDRDQDDSRKAIEEFSAVLELYPTSQYGDVAREEIRRVRQTLAAHELHVGHFYYRYGNLAGAASRLEYVLEEYPDYEETDRVLHVLGLVYMKGDRTEDAQQTFDRLAEEYPDSRWASKIPKQKSS